MGIPVMGHLGLTPQSFLNQGLKKQGEKDFEKLKIKDDALLLQKNGVFAIVLECVKTPIAKKIYKTEVNLYPDGDTFFPEYNTDEWREVARSDFTAQNNSFTYSYLQLNRI